jgi:flagellar biosynthetic protein FliR
VTIHLEANAVVAFAYALVRATAFLVTCPPFASSAIPFMAQTAIACGLAFAAITPLAPHIGALSTPALIEGIVIQVVVGSMIGFVVRLFVAAVQGAGTLADTFTGLNLPPAIDPLDLEQVPLIGQLYQWVATILIFTTGADALLVRGFLHSFAVIGTTIPAAAVARTPAVLSADLVSFFAGAVEIAAPLVAVLVAAQLLLGLLAKASPQANVFSLGFPFQLLLGLITLGLALVALPADVSNLVSRAAGQLFGGS